MPSCPQAEDCKNCMAELEEKIFRKKIMGGKVDPPVTWCQQAKDIGIFIDRIVNRNQECYDALKMITSSPIEIIYGHSYAVVSPKLWDKAIDIVNGGFK